MTAHDFFNELPQLMKQADSSPKYITIPEAVSRHEALLSKILEALEQLTKLFNMQSEHVDDIHNTLYEICPGLMTFEEICETDEERKIALRKYMNLSVESEDPIEIIDWMESHKETPVDD